ncbi:zinc finger protein GLIS2-like isoform X1 [Phyllopteryx taeniolatus]|uniref:zinc finger protein GLIS2-like isoform X1 n=1 Tax=Phyllopteryx taeniolatus TaxID=161469 RepID=UPI002AD4FAAA|nr:zinc finger protein GLIS2-like isoform X1 [Phyllopteryx taeniolatus]
MEKNTNVTHSRNSWAADTKHHVVLGRAAGPEASLGTDVLSRPTGQEELVLHLRTARRPPATAADLHDLPVAAFLPRGILISRIYSTLDSQSPCHERPGSCFTPPAMDLSLSPSSRHASSLSPSPSSPSPSSPPSPLESPHSSRSSGSPRPHPFLRVSEEATLHRRVEGDASPQRYPFYLPIASTPVGYGFPSSVFNGQKSDMQVSPEPSLDAQLACRWIKCHLLFESLQDLVDHINDAHVKPEKDSGYCCKWQGCARNGRGFNARYKMLIHIRTHTNEKPHHCPTCSKSFSRLENLKIHTRSHTGEKPYICPYEGCSKRYSNSSDRFKHTRTHYVDKPYCCKMAGCLKRYTDPSSLRKHIKAHGHFVSQEQGAAPKPGPLGDRSTADLSSGGGAAIIHPGAAAALLGGLGTTLPLSALCRPRAPLFSMVGRGALAPLGLADSPLFHFGLSAASMLGLSALGRLSCAEVDDGAAEPEGDVLNLSSRVAPRRRDPLSWVVVPPRALLLKPAVVS